MSLDHISSSEKYHWSLIWLTFLFFSTWGTTMLIFKLYCFLLFRILPTAYIAPSRFSVLCKHTQWASPERLALPAPPPFYPGSYMTAVWSCCRAQVQICSSFKTLSLHLSGSIAGPSPSITHVSVHVGPATPQLLSETLQVARGSEHSAFKSLFCPFLQQGLNDPEEMTKLLWASVFWSAQRKASPTGFAIRLRPGRAPARWPFPCRSECTVGATHTPV